jgi:hypothetical protein
VTDADGPLFMPYIPRLTYRDIALPVDPDHPDALRQRDLEIFTAQHGPFFRRQLPGEFNTEAGWGYGHFVVVDFSDGKWHRQLGKRRALTAIKTRGGKR